MHRARQRWVEPTIDAIEALISVVTRGTGRQHALDLGIDPAPDGAKGEQRRRHRLARIGQAFEWPAEGIGQRPGESGVPRPAATEAPAADLNIPQTLG